MTQAGPPPPPPVTAIKLTDEIKEAVNGAFTNRTPVVFAYVNPEGQPRVSLRGSTQAYSDDQLAIWVRNPSGGFAKAIDKNNRVTLLYRDPATRTNYFFEGRARIDNGEAVRKQVYESSVEAERNADPEQKGMPAIIDLDSVEGGPPGNRVRMARNA